LTRIFRKFLVAYLVIAVLIIGSLTLILTQLFREHVFREKQSLLLEAGRYANTLMVQYNRGNISRSEMENYINIIGETVNSRVVVLEGVGGLQAEDFLRGRLGVREGRLAETMERILQGETLTASRYFASDLKTHVVAVAMPLRLEGDIRGAVLLFTPVYQLDRGLAQMYGKIRWVALLIFLACGIAVFYISKGISDPIARVSRTARELALGREVGDLPSAGRDEAAELVRSFNFMKNRVLAVDKLKKELLAGVSHELRTPLTAIRGFIQGILDGVVPEKEQRKYLELALQDTWRLSRLVSDLLDLAKIEAGGLLLQKERVDLGRLAGEVAEMIAHQAVESKIEVTVNLPAKEVTVTADGGRVRQVVWNLLANAIVYNNPGGRVEVKVASDDEAAMVEVRDTGIGIPGEELPFIFDKFFRVDKSRDAALGGTGLGLAIVRSLAELHGGRVEVESSPGQGAVFRVYLPF
jgi:signal transduction histidine kinase